jgi:uncharacterized nucleotidyltransferase DUF6036
MTRAQLEHLIRAAADIADDTDIVVIGSQAILGQFPDAPASMRVSSEADLYPLHRPERADLIDGSIGELSPFHNTYNYYAQGVSETTALLPDGWKERLIIIQNENTRNTRGLCLEVHDLLASKALAGREKDIDFISEAAKHRLADKNVLLSRLERVPTDRTAIERAQALIRRNFPDPNS